MLIVPMIGVLIMHDVLQNYVTMKVIVITNYLSNTITYSNNDININQQRYRIFIDFWGRGCSETVRSVQIKPGDLSGGVHIVTLMTVEHYRY